MKSLRARLLMRISLAILAVELAMLVVSVGFRYYELSEMGYTEVTPGHMEAPVGPGGQPLPPPSVNLIAYTLRIAVAVLLVISGSIVLLYFSLNDVILNPVRRIIAANEAMSEGRVDSGHIDPASMPDNEWAAIVASRERAIQHHQDARDQLKAYNEQLEAKVEKRTRQLQETSTELIQAEKLATLGAVSASFVHELSHPLTAIYFNLEPMTKALAHQPEVTARLHDIRSHLRTLQTLIDNFRTFSRKPDPARSLDFNVAVSKACDILRHQFHNRSIHLDVSLADGLPGIWADETLVQQITLNLLTNARDAIAAAGRNGTGKVSVATRAAEQGAELVVGDNGCGIAEQDRSRIFDPFFTTKSPEAGTGLGLPIVHTIVKDLGGSIRVDSRPGEGSTFAVKLLSRPPADVFPAAK